MQLLVEMCRIAFRWSSYRCSCCRIDPVESCYVDSIIETGTADLKVVTDMSLQTVWQD